jgi:UDP-N-acetyl-D-mannosaminuronic acid transferase (WecB/TagA/CpsF family)
VGAHGGHFRTSGTENDSVIEEINKAAPSALLVALGFPLQERWIAANPHG